MLKSKYKSHSFLDYLLVFTFVSVLSQEYVLAKDAKAKSSEVISEDFKTLNHKLAEILKKSGVPQSEVGAWVGVQGAQSAVTIFNHNENRSMVFTALFHLDTNLGLVGELADSWSYKDLTYTFTLRPGLEFSNHLPVSAEDILFSFSEFMSPKSPFSSNFKMIEHIDAQYSEVERKLKIKLKSFSSSFLTDLRVIKILPK